MQLVLFKTAFGGILFHRTFTYNSAVTVVVKLCYTHLWVGVFAGKVSEVTEDLALHVVFQGGEPAVGLLVHRVVQLQKLHQLLRLHLIGKRDFCFKNTNRQRKDDRGCIINPSFQSGRLQHILIYINRRRFYCCRKRQFLPL